MRVMIRLLHRVSFEIINSELQKCLMGLFTELVVTVNKVECLFDFYFQMNELTVICPKCVNKSSMYVVRRPSDITARLL